MVIRTFIFSTILAFSSGMPHLKASQVAGSRLASPLEGIYNQADNGLALLRISAENLIVGTTISLPSPDGDGTRYTPQFPQSLVYDEDEGYYSTVGFYNDGKGVFRNIQLRVRLYAENRFLDVTLVPFPICPRSAEMQWGGDGHDGDWDDGNNGDWDDGKGDWDDGKGDWDDGNNGDWDDGKGDDDCEDNSDENDGGNENGNGDGNDDENDDGNSNPPDEPTVPDPPSQPQPCQPELMYVYRFVRI